MRVEPLHHPVSSIASSAARSRPLILDRLSIFTAIAKLRRLEPPIAVIFIALVTLALAFSSKTGFAQTEAFGTQPADIPPSVDGIAEADIGDDTDAQILREL